eukprot:1208745-Rhodomonas_salina.1
MLPVELTQNEVDGAIQMKLAKWLCNDEGKVNTCGGDTIRIMRENILTNWNNVIVVMNRLQENAKWEWRDCSAMSVEDFANFLNEFPN